MNRDAVTGRLGELDISTNRRLDNELGEGFSDLARDLLVE
jgi:hypothetical protein